MKYLFLFISFYFFLFPFISSSPALAADEGIIFSNPVTALSDKTIPGIIGGILQKSLGVVGVVALVIFIAAGFIWMTARGEAQKIKTAQTMMVWAAIGLLVIFGSYAILKFVFGLIQ